MAKKVTSTKMRSMKFYQYNGWTVWDTETKIFRGPNMFPKTKDLFNFIDHVAMKKDRGLLGVQSTTPGQVREHKRKCESLDAFYLWLTHSKFEIHSWDKARLIIFVPKVLWTTGGPVVKWTRIDMEDQSLVLSTVLKKD